MAFVADLHMDFWHRCAGSRSIATNAGDFGIFKVKTRASRVGRNPRTGGEVSVPERRVVVFKSGKKMTDAVAQSLTRQDESRTRTGGDRPSE